MTCVSIEAFKNEGGALAGVAQWTECWPVNQRPQVRFPVTHAWFADQVPGWGRVAGN